jgi:hypothetical protein
MAIASDEKDLPSLSLCSFSRYLASPLGGERSLVNQVGACIIYIGDVLDYGPATSAEEARAECCHARVNDYL